MLSKYTLANSPEGRIKFLTPMQKKLTIKIDESLYEGFYATIGPRQISRFIEELVEPYIVFPDLAEGYRQMAEDRACEFEALEWAEGTVQRYQQSGVLKSGS
jgi:hypothetical protein